MKIEYRTPTGTGSYTNLADEGATGSTDDRISGYSASPDQSALFRGGLWTVRFAVSRVHATPAEALLYVPTQGNVFAVPGFFKKPNVFDLKVTLDSQVLNYLNAGCCGFAPEPASDRSTFIAYVFQWGIYSA